MNGQTIRRAKSCYRQLKKAVCLRQENRLPFKKRRRGREAVPLLLCVLSSFFPGHPEPVPASRTGGGNLGGCNFRGLRRCIFSLSFTRRQARLAPVA
ncbi:hypothetical protein B4135_3377 [Caldibacillus debilis]|uniref:Uncharacterized protein n=1 Tax=Caldibacillus debilis TaxID=301148 RepID=A0A150LF60_9BACI|nr:hypothetical protein B4135_3377 [Caldibacillus debilis]